MFSWDNYIEVIILRNTKSKYKNEEPIETEVESEEQFSEPQTSNDGFVTVKKGSSNIFCLTIIGQIEGHYILPSQNKTTKYEHIIPQIVEIEENPEIDGLLVILNTVGGDVEAGLAIAELLAGMKKPTVSLVLGGGHSIGVPLAVSAKTSFIAKSATMTIHPVRMNGLMLGVPQTLEYFQRIQDRITNFVIENSSVSEHEFMRLIMNTQELVTDVGTVLDGEQAVEIGLIDKVGTLAEALNYLTSMISRENKKKNVKKKNVNKRSTGRKLSRL